MGLKALPQKRIAITPEIVKKYISLGFEISLSKNYGSHLGIKDEQYKDIGVNILKDEIEVLNSSDIIVQPSMYRRLASTIFDFVRNTIVGLSEFSDTQCGFKAAQSASIKPIYSQALIDRFMFDVEILFLSKKSKLDIKELPVEWKDSPGSTVRFWSGVYEMFRDLIFIRRVHG